MTPAPELVERFRADVEALAREPDWLGLAVSGGPDSLALLLLAAAAFPGRVQAATVDHGLRPESAGEADFVAGICAGLAVPHQTLTAQVPRTGNLQAAARHERYEALNVWLRTNRLPFLLTAHHVDDQAETLLMRLCRGSGVRGLAGVRAVAEMPVEDRGPKLLRPLLGWRRSELAAVVAATGIEGVEDPSNVDDRFDRARIRKRLGEADWLDPAMLAQSAANLSAADQALEWATLRHWDDSVKYGARLVRYRPGGAPTELQLRIVEMILVILAGDGRPDRPRGRDLVRLLATLHAGGVATLFEVKCSGGAEWRFEPAPPRRPAASRL